jgi:hypothetical protein
LAPGVNNLSQWLLVTEIMSFKTITTSYWSSFYVAQYIYIS